MHILKTAYSDRQHSVLPRLITGMADHPKFRGKFLCKDLTPAFNNKNKWNTLNTQSGFEYLIFKSTLYIKVTVPQSPNVCSIALYDKRFSRYADLSKIRNASKDLSLTLTYPRGTKVGLFVSLYDQPFPIYKVVEHRIYRKATENLRMTLEFYNQILPSVHKVYLPHVSVCFALWPANFKM